MRRLLIVLLMAGCSIGDPASPEPLAIERPSDGHLAQRLRRLGARELSQSILDLTGVAVPNERVAVLLTRRKYDNGDPDAWVTTDVLAAIEDLAWFVADEVVRVRPARVWGGCDVGDGCRAHVFDVVLPRILRRALSVGEQASYGKLWDDSQLTGPAEGLRAVIAAALQSPVFLYREEVGQIAPQDAIAVLQPNEIAAELSFLVTGSTPDDELLAVARDARLLEPEARLAQTTRLLQTPAAAALERHFLELYFATIEVSEIRKSEKVYPDYEGGVKLGADFRAMLDEIVRGGGSTHELLTHEVRLGAPLQAAYAGGPPIQGALMHPAFLATHGGFEHSNPVARGLFVLTSLLCSPPPPPPAGIPRSPADKSTTTTTREKYAKHSEGSCQVCHKAIDGIGFGFEEFDGTGKFRDRENGKPVDASGLLPADGTAVPYRGVSELTARLALSQQVTDCFGKHVVRFALGGGERTEDAALYESLARGGTPATTYEARLRQIIASESFVRRRAP